MYFEGCLCFKDIQQSGLMKEVFVGSLPNFPGLWLVQKLSLDWTFEF